MPRSLVVLHVHVELPSQNIHTTLIRNSTAGTAVPVEHVQAAKSQAALMSQCRKKFLKPGLQVREREPEEPEFRIRFPYSHRWELRNNLSSCGFEREKCFRQLLFLTQYRSENAFEILGIDSCSFCNAEFVVGTDRIPYKLEGICIKTWRYCIVMWVPLIKIINLFRVEGIRGPFAPNE